MSDARDRDNFCSIPFLQLQLNPLGNVSACCYSQEHKVGSIQENTLLEIWNGTEMQKWREEFISGDIKICKAAMKNFECHKMYTHLNKFVELKTVQEHRPRRLDLRLNGKCNLECIMCDVWSQPNGLYENSDLWTEGPTKIFPYLLEVDMLGGEPFIQRDTFKFIDAVSAVNSTCTWGFITNGSYVFNDKIQQTLEKINLRYIHLSMDGVTKAVYEKIRKKGVFEKTVATINDYVEYRNERKKRNREFSLFASLCVQRDNWHEIGQFLNFCNEREIFPRIQSVIGREHLSLNQLSDEEYAGILKIIEPYLETQLRPAVLPLWEDVKKFKLARRESLAIE